MTKTQKLMIVLFTLICLVACSLTLAFYFGFKPKNNANSCNLELQNVVVFQGEKAKINCQISDKRYEISYSVADENVAKVVDDSEVVGLQVGETFLYAKAKNKGQEYSALAQIKVIAKENSGKDNDDDNQNSGNSDGNQDDDQNVNQYQSSGIYVDIKPILNCKFLDNKLYVSDLAVFTIQIFNDSSKTSPLIFNLTCTSNLSLDIDLNYFYLTAKGNGRIYIDLRDKNAKFYIEVIAEDVV